MSTRNYYEVLGLATGADGAMVDQAYWHLAKTYQQLAPQDPRAEHLLDELNEAYSVLGTPRLREEYDLQVSSGTPTGRRLAATPGKAKTKPGTWLKMPRFSFLRTERPREPVVSSATKQQSVVAATGRVAGRDRAQDLRASTAAMLERWRSNAGIQPAEQVEPEPDMTLVDIFRSERELETAEDPLASVMDVLRRTKTPAPVE